MKQFILKHKKAITGIAGALAIGAITMSFQDSPFVNHKLGVQEMYEDTIKPRKKITQAEWDKAMNELEQSMQYLAKELKQLDMGKINAGITTALKEVDVQKIMHEVQQSLKAVDTKKIMEEINTALKEVDAGCLKGYENGIEKH
jgi:hypothetical protein